MSLMYESTWEEALKASWLVVIVVIVPLLIIQLIYWLKERSKPAMEQTKK